MIRAIDLFCGAGGSSWGAQRAGARIVAGFDMWGLARRTYQDNFLRAQVYSGRLERISATRVQQEVGRVRLILASPECTSHSVARGSRDGSEDSRKTAFQVVRFARKLKPRWIVIENVVSMRVWNRYDEFLGKLRKLGYKLCEQVLDAADFGVPQSRRRLFIMCDKQRLPKPLKPKGRKLGRAADAINLNGVYPLSRLWTANRAPATLLRARRALKAVGPNTPFLLVYYSTDGAGGWQRLTAPLRTVTTLDRFALVKRRRHGRLMRMLQVPELQAAMGFPRYFQLNHGSRRDRIHLLGNAVCPPVMKAIVKALTKQGKGRKGQAIKSRR